LKSSTAEESRHGIYTADLRSGFAESLFQILKSKRKFRPSWIIEPLRSKAERVFAVTPKTKFFLLYFQRKIEAERKKHG